MITAHRITGPADITLGYTIVIDTIESARRFEELVQRATNLWPDAHPEIKEFADLITNHKVLQQYSEQSKSRKKE